MFYKKIKYSFICFVLLTLQLNCNDLIINSIDPENPIVGYYFTIHGAGLLNKDLKLFVNDVLYEKDSLEVREWQDNKITLIMPDTYGKQADIRIVCNDIKIKKTVNLNKIPAIVYNYPVRYLINLDIIIRFYRPADLKDLYIYVPQAVVSDELIKKEIISTNVQPDYIQDNGIYIYDLKKLSGNTFTFDQTMDITTVYKKINFDEKIEIYPYDKETVFYKHYVQSEDPNIIPYHEVVRKKMREIIGNEQDQIKKLRALYKWTTNKMVMDYEPPSRSPLYSIESGIGDCLSDVLLFTSLSRSAGYPTRINTGYIFYHTLDTGSLHNWSDVFIPGIGWVPIDISYGHQPDFLYTMQYFTPPSYFFGGNDGRKMAFTKGRIKLMKPDENNNLVFYKYLEMLQKPHIADIKTDTIYYNYSIKMKINVIEFENLYDDTKKSE